ncbi:helix-turn-helix domain-containing protein [Siphonobacter sp. SORGH_AS_0500]|uniref:helix-turn-helix domain-containing protein n=1 Tax=Siphonobacter sp. SORGH_AS_0500 TaxID=1864824 RepID=UPI00285AE648|nr:helix-turn-helix domain-containing protein [Siphonobacter sp. SORGH_AS_0500]MDR6197551.1 AraC family transcriptional activator of pobA [Siphonobacter sp. SORGH_AS_0500]
MKLFENLVAYNNYMGGPPPLDKDFDVSELEVFQRHWEKGEMPLIRHDFYSIRLVEELKTDLNPGHHTTRPEVPFLLFKSPFQVLSWQTQPGFKKGWHLTFTDAFLQERPQISNIIQEFPFLHLEKAIPFTVSAYDRDALVKVFHKMQEAYQSDSSDRFALIASYLHIMLFRIKGLYAKAASADPTLGMMVRESDDALYDDFINLIDSPEHRTHQSVTDFARELDVTPGYLNAVTSRVTGEDVRAQIHDRIITQAKDLLLNSSLGLEELARKLEFRQLTDFNAFFEKYVGLSPLQFQQKSR